MYMTDREKKTATIITGTGLALATVVILVWGMGGCASKPRETGGTALITAAPSLPSDGGTTAGTAPTPVGTPDGSSGGPPAGGQGGGGSGGQNGSGQGGGGQGGGQGGGTGGTDGPIDDGNDLPDPPDPAPEDCPAYDPSGLFIFDAGASGWQLWAPGHVIALLDTKFDAIEALKVARRWTHSCYIGRGNDRSNRYRYIVRYWTGPSDLPLGLAPQGSCSPYDPAKLVVKKLSNLGWQLFSGNNVLLLLDTEADAQRAKLVAANRHALCFIGRNNTRPDHYSYLFEYWTG